MTQSEPGQRDARWVFMAETGLRSGWRVLAWTVAFVLALLAGIVLALPTAWVGDRVGLSRGELFLLTNGLTFLPTLALAVLFAVLDKPRLRAGGLGGPVGRTSLEFIGGTLIGGVLVLFTLLPAAILGDVDIGLRELGWATLLVPVWFVGLLIAAAWEEVAFRGYGFQWLCRATGNVLVYAVRPLFALDPDRVAQWVSRAGWIGASALIFGILHGTNPNAGWLSGLNTTLAGVWLAIAVFRSRALWLAIGLHLGWNFAQGPVLGLPISGMGSAESGIVIPSIWRTTMVGPEWLTGGGYGVEAGVPCTVVLLLGIAIAALWPPRKRGDDAPVLRPGRITR